MLNTLLTFVNTTINDDTLCKEMTLVLRTTSPVGEPTNGSLSVATYRYVYNSFLKTFILYFFKYWKFWVGCGYAKRRRE
jgi:hypothetical protein